MTCNRLIIFVLIALAAPAALAAKPGKSINPDSMGLSQGSVFDVPAQKAYGAGAQAPGQNALLPRAYAGAPPQIPHDIADFLPITAETNMCIACHNQPGLWGKPREQGQPTPIPQSHYTDQRNAPGKLTDHLMGARYNCNQCHVPQMNATPLVQNTFGAKRGK